MSIGSTNVGVAEEYTGGSEICPVPTTLLTNANLSDAVIAASYVPGFSMYTLEIVPKSYVFDPYLSVVAVGVMFCIESLLYVSKSRYLIPKPADEYMATIPLRPTCPKLPPPPVPGKLLPLPVVGPPESPP